eukprot:NODE_10901_length_1322_cov_2.266946.p3 GENE.NODE_10901_length_1322_cov_2.266946~~NODE_10901_length_1322_cov_2.266946.p3  ORF type:complete len:135 (-),score=18.60 NODE_10901_length_1322_cov_2.266946:51-455(-)
MPVVATWNFTEQEGPQGATGLGGSQQCCANDAPERCRTKQAMRAQSEGGFCSIAPDTAATAHCAGNIVVGKLASPPAPLRGDDEVTATGEFAIAGGSAAYRRGSHHCGKFTITSASHVLCVDTGLVYTSDAADE